MTNQEILRFVASELRRLAPNAATPEGGTSHDGRRAFQDVAERLEKIAVIAGKAGDLP